MIDRQGTAVTCRLQLAHRLPVARRKCDQSQNSKCSPPSVYIFSTFFWFLKGKTLNTPIPFLVPFCFSNISGDSLKGTPVVNSFRIYGPLKEGFGQEGECSTSYLQSRHAIILTGLSIDRSRKRLPPSLLSCSAQSPRSCPRMDFLPPALRSPRS